MNTAGWSCAPSMHCPQTPRNGQAANGTRVLLADLFRRQSGRLTAVLTARGGPQHLDRVQDAVQDAMVTALRTWPWRGIPANPSGWLSIAARNALLDRLRRARCEIPEEPQRHADSLRRCRVAEPELDEDLLRRAGT